MICEEVKKPENKYEASSTLLGSERPFGQVHLLWQIFGLEEDEVLVVQSDDDDDDDDESSGDKEMPEGSDTDDDEDQSEDDEDTEGD